MYSCNQTAVVADREQFLLQFHQVSETAAVSVKICVHLIRQWWLTMAYSFYSNAIKASVPSGSDNLHMHTHVSLNLGEGAGL